MWAFAIAGILAFIMIVFAGFQYLTAGGNASQQKDAQERIANAIIGLILLFSFYLILHTINPDILKSSKTPFPTPSEQITSEKPQQIGDFVLIGPGAQSNGYVFIPLSNELLQYENIYIEKTTADKLVILASQHNLGDWAISEACVQVSNNQCITTVSHDSACHSLGTCVDVGYGGDPGETISQSFINAANQAGFDVLDEYTNDASLWCASAGSGFHLEPHKGSCVNDGCWFCANS